MAGLGVHPPRRLLSCHHSPKPIEDAGELRNAHSPRKPCCRESQGQACFPSAPETSSFTKRAPCQLGGRGGGRTAAGTWALVSHPPPLLGVSRSHSLMARICTLVCSRVLQEQRGWMTVRESLIFKRVAL